ncbi:TlpA family protein disulfide reductase [Candidatus Kaiserbacteria bacterium]|nr:TlpA family protein disulfide reductase [Candidatus Kaiserbacteria bacterium]
MKHYQDIKLHDSRAGAALSSGETTSKYTDLTGAQLSLDAYLGHTLIVYSWASWCPQCSVDLKALEAYSVAHDDVVILAINRAEPAVTARRYLNATIGTNTKIKLVLDPEDRFFTSLSGYAMPETIFFTPDGSEYSRIRTPLTETYLKETVDKMNNQ